MPLPDLSRNDFARVIDAVLTNPNARKAWAFVGSGKYVVRAARRFKASGRDSLCELLVSFGALNYEERRALKILRKRGDPIPMHVQVKEWPKGTKAGLGVSSARRAA